MRGDAVQSRQAIRLKTEVFKTSKYERRTPDAFFIYEVRRRKMPVERYLAELTLTFDVSDDLIIHRKVEYETYAANPEDAEATARLWAYDFRRNLPKTLRTM